jgi:hypothetical protein
VGVVWSVCILRFMNYNIGYQIVSVKGQNNLLKV